MSSPGPADRHGAAPPLRRVIPALLNPEAGTARAAAAAVAADPRFHLQVVKPGKLLAAVREHLARGEPRLLIAGGDGTIGAAAALMVPAGAELAVLPGGTLNHFARRIGLTEDLRQALEIAAAGTSRSMPVGSVNGRIFLNTSVVGAYTEMIELRERIQPWLGYHLAGALASFATLLRSPHYSLTLRIAGERRSYRTPLLFVGLGRRDLRFPRFGEEQDGREPLLHTIVIPGRSRVRILALAFSALTRGIRRLSRTPHLDSFLVPGFHLEAPGSELHLALDGEIVPLRTPLDYSVLPAALRVMTGSAIGPDSPSLARDHPLRSGP